MFMASNMVFRSEQEENGDLVVLQNVVFRSCEKLYFCEPWCFYPTRSGDNLDPNRNRDALGTPAWPYGQTKALVPVIASRFFYMGLTW